MPDMSQPFFSSRKWIKVWINEWREGTLRWQATDFQRAFWIDLLALAGRSRYPGIVCAGKDAEKIIGYPAAFLAPNSEITPQNIEDTLKLFESKGMLTYTMSNSVQGDALYAITIVNWKKYQSDYEANKKYQKTYRDKKRASSQASESLTSQLDAHQTLEEEREEKLEREKSKNIPPASLAASEFRLFWDAYPKKIGEQRAREAWRKTGCEGRLGEILASLKVWQKTWPDPQFIPRAHRWLSEGLWKENPQAAARKESLHEQLAKLGAKA